MEIEARRNLNKPVFKLSNIRIEVNEHDPVGKNITQVSATDADVNGPKSEISYDIVGDHPADSLFAIHPKLGYVFIKEPLTEKSDKLYIITVVARDQGIPQQSSNAVIRVTVERNDFTPIFPINSDYSRTIGFRWALGSRVVQVEATDADEDVCI